MLFENSYLNQSLDGCTSWLQVDMLMEILLLTKKFRNSNGVLNKAIAVRQN
jgi:hypothetical protein